MPAATSAVLIVVGLLIAGLLTWIGLTLSRRKVTETADAHEALRMQAEAEATVVRSRAVAHELRAAELRT
jgi:ribonuclease Y